MQKSIKRYICIAAILSTMIGYAQKPEELEVVIVTIRNSNKSEAEKQAEIASLQAILNGMYERARAEAEAAAKAKALADAEAAAKAKAQAEAGGSGTPLKEVVVTNTTQIWYLDNDGDGYFGTSKQSSTSPGALWRTSKGAGSDCNDNDATKTNNCSTNTPAPEPTMKGWFLDKDGDGYHGVAQGATTSPGSEWTNSTKGSDCDDTNASKTTDCGTQTPTTPPAPKPDPCAEIKKALADANYKAIMTELQSSATLTKHNETGYWQDNKGVYHPMEINGNRAVKMPADMSTMENLNHAHMNDWKDPVTGDPVDSYPMPSPADIAKVYALGYNSLSNGLNLANTYVGNTSYLGSFQMRFVGNPDSLSAANFVKIYDTIMSNENGQAYELAMKENNNGVEGLLAFLRDTLKTTDIAIYKIEATEASKVELGSNNQITKTPCN